jgi:hypothetical protein
MSLHFLCDQCVPAEISNSLRLQGHKVTLLSEVLPVRSPDSHVISKARELCAILVSLNGDFSNIAAYPPRQFSGIVAIQIRNHPEIIPQLLKHLASFLSTNPAQEFYAGKLIIVEVHRLRIRQ